MALKRTTKGFTLVEVMVALAIVGIAVPALLFAVMQQIDGTAYMRDKMFAQWVAVNKLEEAQIASARNNRILDGSSSGEEQMAGRTWYWEMVSAKTQAEGFLQLQVKVSAKANDDPIVTLIGYVDSYHQGN